MVNEVAPKFEEADGLVVGSPVYYASANATLIAFLDRLFYSTHFDKTMKVGASVVSARRGGLSATFDELNKYFTISGMPVASSQYWNSIHGRTPGEAEADGELLQNRSLPYQMRKGFSWKLSAAMQEVIEYRTLSFSCDADQAQRGAICRGCCRLSCRGKAAQRILRRDQRLHPKRRRDLL